MASRGFVSPGALARNAIAEELMKRAALERQATLDKMAADQQAATIRQRDEALAQSQQQEARIAQAQQQAQEAAERERQFRRASTIATTGLPGIIDADTAGLLRTEGFGTLVTQTQPTQGQHLGVDESGVDQYAVTPGVIQFAGGSQYQQARLAAQERAAAAAQAQESKADLAREGMDLRREIAGAAAAGRQETTDLRNQLLQTQVDSAKQKAEDKAKADKRAKDAARVTSRSTLDVLEQLATFDPTGKATLKSGTANLFGARVPFNDMIPGSDTSNARAALNRLKGRAIVDLLNEMKNQSATGATGFGSLSGSELRLLENSATQLDTPNISDERAAEELSRIYKMAKQLYGDEPTDVTSQGPAVGTRRTINGQLAEWDGKGWLAVNQ